MRDDLIKFFEKFEELYTKCHSTGDADDVLMDLMMFMTKEKLAETLKKLREEFYN